MFDWDDLRYFLAVARNGTTLGAAAELGISQPTVVRRVGALEEAVGMPLFSRSSSGYALTETGTAFLPIAERAAGEIQAAADFFLARRIDAGGRIRLMLPDSMEEFLLPLLQKMRQECPALEVQILTAYRPLDLARGECDMAVRIVADSPADSDALLVRPLPPAGWNVYGAERFAEQRPLPTSPEELPNYPLIGAEGLLADWKAFRWLDQIAPDARFVLRCNSIAGVRTAIRSGIGICPLPCLLANPDPHLVPCFASFDAVVNEMWLVTRRELMRLPQARALFEAIYSHMHACADWLGRSAHRHSAQAAVATLPRGATA